MTGVHSVTYCHPRTAREIIDAICADWAEDAEPKRGISKFSAIKEHHAYDSRWDRAGGDCPVLRLVARPSGPALIVVALFLIVASFYGPISDFVEAIIRGRSNSN